MSRMNRRGVRRKIKTASASFGLNVSIFMNKWLASQGKANVCTVESGFGGLARDENNGNASGAMRPFVNSLIMNDRSRDRNQNQERPCTVENVAGAATDAGALTQIFAAIVPQGCEDLD